MQRRAQNLLHRISPQADTARLCEDVFFPANRQKWFLRATHREHPLWVALGPHVGVVDLLQNHPRLIVFPILEERKTTRQVHMPFSYSYIFLQEDQLEQLPPTHPTLHVHLLRDTDAGRLNHIVMSPLKYTTQNDLGILRYGCKYACAQICNNSQMKCVPLFLGGTKIFTKHEINLQIGLRIKWNTKISQYH